MLTFNTDNMVRQNFAFRAPLMDYIFKNAQPQHLIKLYQTCKLFYNKFRRNIILNLEIVDDNEAEVLTPTKTVICVSNPFLSKFADFWITDSLIYRAAKNNEKLLNFSDCTIKKLELSENILWQEFVMLTKAGTIEKMKVNGIYGETPLTFASVDDIIAQVPNATSIEISNCFFAATTSNALISMERKVKFSSLTLRNVLNPENFDNDFFTKFIIKNATVKCKVHFDFKMHDGDDDLILQLNEALKKYGDIVTELISLILMNIKLKRKLLRRRPIYKYVLILLSVLFVGHVLFAKLK
uniref:F-box domain-containing protein n=1 Tax=Panagrolaimus sp. ES5 TaxID=591445 RepID=A0AC34GY45_9BILA